ncbi:hypothetical protein GCM10020254_02130 [Streptomyces goshikiensis]
MLDAACHVRAVRALDALTRALVDSDRFTEHALQARDWPHSQESALLFGCLLHLVGRMEGAQFWFQYAAGAGSRTAAVALYLLHLSRAEVSTARHWKRQAGELPLDEGLPVLPAFPSELEAPLGASVIWTSPPITTQDLTAVGPPPPADSRSARQLPVMLRRAVTALVPEEDPDLGEVFTTSAQLAIALARCARLNPFRLTQEANPWASLRPAHLTHARRRALGGRAPTALASVHQALRVLEVVNRHTGGVSLAQIARETKLPQLMLARVMEHLVRTNLATPVGPGAYVAGAALVLTGVSGAGGPGQLPQTLAFVRDAVGAAVYVGRYCDGEVSITQYADGPTAPVVEEWVDFRAAAHASAVGKALLTQLDHDGRKDHLARHRADRLTEHTLASEQALFRQLDDRRPNAPLLDLREYAIGTVCAAVPLTSGPNAECVALSLPGPDPRRLRQAARVLQNEAAAVLLALLVSGTAPAPLTTAG